MRDLEEIKKRLALCPLHPNPPKYLIDKYDKRNKQKEKLRKLLQHKNRPNPEIREQIIIAANVSCAFPFCF